MRTIIAVDGVPATQPIFDRALQHIARSYLNTFSADTRIRPSRLAIATARSGEVVCATSIRCHEETFFSQRYLDLPVGELLSQRTGLKVRPNAILEVGALACSTPFAAYPTLHTVFQWGRERGISWGIFTATAEVRRLIQRVKITPHMLARAEASRVENPEQWGNYYDHDPWVCAFQDRVQSGDFVAARGRTA